jgi:cytochrome c oxidase assembly factor CtaG
MRLIPSALLGLALAGPAAAHTLQAPAETPGWTTAPTILVPLVASALLFGTGWLRLAARSGQAVALRRRQGLLFAAGWLVLAGAVVSPLHEAGEHSFAAHMLEHELLMLIAAPLLVLSDPLPVMLWAFPAPARRSLGGLARLTAVRAFWRWLTAPAVATLLQAAALWLWHMPGLFDRALASEGWHVAQHLSFLVSALLFWSAVMPGRRGNPMLAALCLFATSLISGALGAMMAFSTSPWYAGYSALGLAPFGLTPAEDQQLAGLLMWIPGGLVHAGAALAAIGVALGRFRGGREAAHAGAR